MPSGVIVCFLVVTEAAALTQKWKSVMHCSCSNERAPRLAPVSELRRRFQEWLIPTSQEVIGERKGEV